MLKIFKDIYMWYMGVAMAGGLGFIFGIGVGFDKLALAIALMLLWVLVFAIVFSKMANKRYMKIAQKRENCRVGEYTATHEKFLKRKLDHRTEYAIRLNLFIGYCDLGELDKAENIIWEIEPKFKRKNARAATYEAAYYADMAHFYGLKKDEEKKREFYGKLEEALKNEKIAETPKMMWQRNIEKEKVHSLAKRGQTDEAIKFFEKAFEEEETLLGKVSVKLVLADIYTMKNDNEKAKEAVKYVIENGGDTYMVKEAEKMIK